MKNEKFGKLRIVYKNTKVRDREKLIKQVLDLTLSSPINLVIVFESEEYDQGWPRIFRDKAFYMNILCGGVEGRSPSDILNIMKDPDCEHFIWVSKAISESDDIKFAWVLTHEIQHAIQDSLDQEISEYGHFLGEFLAKVKNNTIWLEIPTELDAERVARKVVMSLFGEMKLGEFIISESVGDNKRIFSEFDTLDKSISGDIKNETLKILCRYKDFFKKMQDLTTQKNRKRRIDFDSICRDIQFPGK